jgi:GNAT superfamily N-acetyltransferase
MSTLTIHPQKDFPGTYKWQALAFMRCVWPSIFQGDILYLSETYPPEPDTMHFVVAEGDVLLSYAAVLKQGLAHNDQKYTAAGFGNMLTFPPYRKQGHGRQALRAATDFIHKSDVDVAILYCDASLESYYASEGWAVTPSPTRVGRPDQYSAYEPSRMMLFVSTRGQAAKKDFESLPVYVDWTW